MGFSRGFVQRERMPARAHASSFRGTQGALCVVMLTGHAPRGNALLVDERPHADGSALASTLESLGPTLFVAGSCEEALAQLRERSFALVVLVVRAAGLDVFAVAAAMRDSKARRTSILFVSDGEADARDVERAYALGAVDVFREPLDARAFSARARALLELQRRCARLAAVARRARRELARAANVHRDGTPAPSALPIECASESHSAECALRGLRVLVVEDDQDGRELLELLLLDYGASVTAVGNTRDAMEQLRASLPDLVISDIGLPLEDGCSFLRRVRALPPEQGGRVPAIAVSAYTSADVRVRVRASGFAAHLTKPIDPHELAVAVESLGVRARSLDAAMCIPSSHAHDAHHPAAVTT